ncbi:MAG: hypothetical protein COA79_07925 [Planctomycetota bacterium]|nr:MAG: hypothetical protein COA79_07925 [Planctomycetota bacterium]
MPKSNTEIINIDPNLITKEASNSLHWTNAKELTIQGKGWDNQENYYYRFPQKAKNIVRPPVWKLSTQSAGIAIHFRTNSTSINVKWKTHEEWNLLNLTAYTSRGLDLYVKILNRWKWVASTCGEKADEYEKEILSGIDSKEREYKLYLPLYGGITNLEIGIEKNKTLISAKKDNQPPIVFYGTSILQGASASRPGMAYPSIIERFLNRESINLGFSGNAWLDLEVADLLCELNPALYVIDCLPNVTAAVIEEKLILFIEKLRKQHPFVPILLVESTTYTNAHLVSDRQKRYESSNEALNNAYEKLQEAGYERIYYQVDQQLNGDDGEGTIDGTHLTDLGFMRMAKKIGEKIKLILAREDV